MSKGNLKNVVRSAPINVLVKKAEDVGKVVTALKTALTKHPRQKDQVHIYINHVEVPQDPEPEIEGSELL